MKKSLAAQKQNFLRDSQRGSILLQVIIIIGVTVAATMGTLRLVSSSQTDLAQTLVHQEAITLQQDLYLAIQRAEICQASLVAKNFSATSSTPAEVTIGVKDASGNSTLVKAGETIPVYSVKVNELNLTDPVLWGVLPSGDRVYQVQLKMKSEPTKAIPYPFREVTIGKLYVEVRSNNVSNCYSGQDPDQTAKSTCEILGGTYTSGNCALKPYYNEIRCPAGEYLESFNQKESTKNCKRFYASLPPPPAPTATPTPTPPPAPTPAPQPRCNAAYARASYCPISGTYCGAVCTSQTTQCVVTGTQCINMSGTCNRYCANLPGL